MSPFGAANRQFFMIGMLLTIIAVIGKLLAGYAAFGRPMRKLVIGVGMVPRGEVGLIFAQLGLSTGLLSAGLYSSVAMVVLVTTFVAPPTLRALLAGAKKESEEEEESRLADLVTEVMTDGEGRERQDEGEGGQ